MARFQPTAPSIDQLRLVCLVLGNDGTVLWENTEGRQLGMVSLHPAAQFTDLAHPDDQAIAKDLFDEASHRRHAQRTLRIQDIAGEPRHLHLMLDRGQQPSWADAGNFSGNGDGDTFDGQMIVQGWDVSHLIARQEELEAHAFRDPLTGVPNRLAFMARLGQELGLSRLPRHQVAVLFADVDDFTSVNDRYGHDIGDRVLTELAGRLLHAVRPGDLFGRIGSDEFAVICPDLIGWSAATAVIDRLRMVAAQPISTPAGEISVTISLGAAFAEESDGHPDAAADLVARADHRMFKVEPEPRRPAPGSPRRVVSR